MRRKDWKYYLKTIKLRIAALVFKRKVKTQSYQDSLLSYKKEYRQKLDEVRLNFSNFDPIYHTYFYFKDTQIFQTVYEKEATIPILLKGQKVKNPLLPFYYGLVLYNQLLSEANSNYSIFLKIDQITDEMSSINSNGILYNYQEDYDLFSLKAPWKAGITQALACSYFCRRGHMTQDSSFINKAEKIFNPLTISLKDGGLLQATSEGLEWVEEYPSKPASYVLNGHMFAIIAAIELFQSTNKKIYELHARQWITSLIHHLPEYQYKHYLLHNKFQDKLSNLEYQGLYVGLFKHLYQITKHPIFLEFYTFYNGHMQWNEFNRFYGIKN